MRHPRGITLLELVVVMAVIAVLAALAIPNLLEAQVRSKVAATQANLRTLKGALEAYRVDAQALPINKPVDLRDPLGVLADVQLRGLTTPVAYLSSGSFRDEFGRVRNQMVVPTAEVAGISGMAVMPNAGMSVLYVHYPSFARLTDNPLVAVEGAALISLGPDQIDSFGAFGPFPEEALPVLSGAIGINKTVDTIYDPTNGTVSGGDITVFIGPLRGR